MENSSSKWPKLLGARHPVPQATGYSRVLGALFDGFDTKTVDGVVVSTPKIPAPPADKAAISDPAAWAQESFALAKTYAYADPVLEGDKPELTRDYEKNTRQISEQQVSLAAARLANLVNAALGGPWAASD
ncbi:hypothetical protein B5K05_13495 [Rhizobium phaseoli]|uniref:S1/P1 nuclease n=1 Tax=Rhizobium phaseoli TaxID=396 RepID=UPI000E0D4391|nr:S1/P1 nuclease [Rhizobium phaseoli]RDJ10138.1 hypothetical protein B5K04_13470 [Rhizobium phaseoli]RDJ14138.1 hypothetical protein B5K05_13495 [Rhizobium phaseoli]